MARLLLCLGLCSVALAQSSIAVAPRSMSATGAADIRIGRAQDVHALGELLSEGAKAKFVPPSQGADVVEREYIVTMLDTTPPARVTRTARQLQAAGAVLRYVGNQQFGWKGISFKVPAAAAAETARLLDGLMQSASVSTAQANYVVRLTPTANNVDAAAAAMPAAGVPVPRRRAPVRMPGQADRASCVAVTADTLTKAGAPSWGLSRIGSRNLNISTSYEYATNGAAANVFVVDTGAQFDHPELKGRVFGVADGGFDAFGADAADYQGHGTHCSGTIAGLTTGISKGVSVYSVRVLDADGGGTSDTVIAGLNHVANSNKPNRIISMSLGGGRDDALNAAAEAAVKAGVLVVVAAGNENQDACNVSPASAPSAVTVGASNKADVRAGFSNYGSCVDIFAPGVGIYSSTIPSTYATWSGTSMATPHVAGVAARLWSRGACTSNTDCAEKLKCLATPGKVTGLDAASPNLLLYIPAQV